MHVWGAEKRLASQEDIDMAGTQMAGTQMAGTQMAGTQAQSTVDPAKWLAILRVWVPTEPLEVLVALINSLIEASGAVRGERLDGLIAHTDRTTRSGREKFERLRQWCDKMRADSLFWPQRFVRPRAVSILIKAILDKSSRPLDRFEVERKFRKFRDVPPSGLSQELKEMARRGEIDRHFAGRYWRKGTTEKPYESQTQQLYRLVHDAPGHRMANADLAVTMHISRKDLETLLSQTRKRWRDPPLFERPNGAGVTAASGESLALLKRDGLLVDGRRGVFFKTPEVVSRAEGVTFTTLHSERPPFDSAKLAQEIARIKAMKKRQRSVALDALAKDSGVPVATLELMVRPAEQDAKNAIQKAAKEKWRVHYRELAKQPERMPVRTKLWEEVRRDPGMTRQIFRDVISEEAPGTSGPRPGNSRQKTEKDGANSP
jgi:hypothetical protein